MQCYRIMSEAYHKKSLYHSVSAGRWNLKGTRMIYAGSTPTVSLPEYSCIKGTAVTNKPWFMVVYDISDETHGRNISLPAD